MYKPDSQVENRVYVSNIPWHLAWQELKARHAMPFFSLGGLGSGNAEALWGHW